MLTVNACAACGHERRMHVEGRFRCKEPGCGCQEYQEQDMADTLDRFDFSSLEPIEIPVTLPGGKRYVLREATADGARVYNNASAKLARMQDGKVVGVGDAGDLEPLLVSKCLYEPDKDGRLRLDANGNPDARWQVKEGVVRTWPTRIVRPLFEEAKRISGMDVPDTEESLAAQMEAVRAKLAALRVRSGRYPLGTSDGDEAIPQEDGGGEVAEGNGLHRTATATIIPAS